MQQEKDWQSVLREDAGNPAFAEYAEYLRVEKRLSEALEISLTGLSANPTLAKGRLVLARVFFELGYLPFALRELQALQTQLPTNQWIEKLIERIEPGSAKREGGAVAEEETIAEGEFDFDELEMIVEEDEKEI